MGGLTAIIQHTSSRPRHLDQLLTSLSPYKPLVSVDDSGYSWPGLKKALIAGIESGADHILILQDDIIVCKDFIPAVTKVIALYPKLPITYFSSRPTAIKSFRLKKQFCKIKHFTYAQAYSLPREMAIEFLDFQAVVRESLMVDDTRLAIFFMAKNIDVMVTTPSLVQHLCWDSSTTDSEKRGVPLHKFDTRTSGAYIGLEKSALDINWQVQKSPLCDDSGDVEAFQRYLV